MPHSSCPLGCLYILKLLVNIRHSIAIVRRHMKIRSNRFKLMILALLNIYICVDLIYLFGRSNFERTELI